MASFLDKLKVNTPLTNYTRLDLSSDHITTANFMQFNCAYAKEVVPHEKLNIKLESFVRLQPLPVPTFGRARLQNRCFFVPYRTIFEGWQDFITDARHSYDNGNSGMISHVPQINNSDLNSLFMGQFMGSGFPYIYDSLGNLLDVGDESNAYDYMTTDGRKVLLTSAGRWFMKLLNSLGYQVIWESAAPQERPESNQALWFSALPLLAVAKVYADWYFPSHYASTPEFSSLEAIFNRNTLDNNLTIDDLYTIVAFLRKVNYDSDYFTSAWQNPVTPNDGTYSPMTMTDITDEYTSLGANNMITTSQSVEGTPLVKGQGTSLTHFSQYAIDALKAMTDYLKRHQLVGGRALDRYLARFGVKLSDEVLRRSQYVGTSEQNIQFGDVMATASTEDARLGQYAGKGIGYTDGTFSFDNEKDYGIIIVISTIVPKTGYYQGIDRNVLHTTKLDFWTPEFDNLGVQAISRAELYVNTYKDPTINESDRPALNQYQAVFGFTPRYAEYKVGKDRLSGDFRYHSVNEGLNSWHTMREINPERLRDLVISPEFVSGDDSTQYSRIFATDTSGEYDQFTVIHSLDVTAETPMKSLFDTYDFEQKGNEVMMQANGVKMN